MRYLLGFILAGIFVSCAIHNQIKVVDNLPIDFVKPFYKMIYPGEKEADKEMLLVLAYEGALNDITLDSVYFRGYHQKLTENVRSGYKVFQAKFKLLANHKFIESPVDISNEQALISFSDKTGLKQYYLVPKVVEEKPVYMP